MYRKDLMEKAGLKMPEKPTWEFIKQAADKMTDKAAGVYGICLRGKPGWGENMAFLTATANSFGARWFDEKWKPQFNSPEWKATLDYYVPLMKADGPPGASSNGFNENLALFNDGKCGMWIDATVAASIRDRRRTRRSRTRSASRSRPTTASASAATGCGRGRWRIPAGSNKVDAAEKFISWATSKHYADLVASKEGWSPTFRRARALRSTRTRNIRRRRPSREPTLNSINSADPTHPTVKPVPYIGVQFVAIPEFQGIATDVGQDFSAALAGTMTVDAALAKAQASTEAAMKKAGYIK